jgi:hypothetical protein
VKVRRSEIDGLIELLINSFKRSKNLPYAIKTNVCPKYKKNCTRHHGEIVVISFDMETKKFHCKYYGVHIPKTVFECDQTEDIVKSIIKKSLNTTHRRKSLVTVKELKKFLKSPTKSKEKMTGIAFRCSEEVKQTIRSNAKKNGFSEMSDYIILKLLS